MPNPLNRILFVSKQQNLMRYLYVYKYTSILALLSFVFPFFNYDASPNQNCTHNSLHGQQGSHSVGNYITDLHHLWLFLTLENAGYFF